MKLLAKIKKRAIRLFPKKRVARHNNTWFLLDPLNWIDNRMLSGLGYEQHLIDAMLKAIAEHQIDTMLDIGANIGYYSLLAAKHAPQLNEIHAFEPVKRNLYQMHASLYLNGFEHKVHTHHLALSNKAEKVTIHIDPRSTGISRLSLDHARRDTSVFKEQETIRTGILDDLVPHTGRRVFVKIDTEGHELDVLRGMTQYLRDNKCYMLIEISPENEAPVAELLTAAGYTLQGNSKDNFFYSNF